MIGGIETEFVYILNSLILVQSDIKWMDGWMLKLEIADFF